MQGTLNCDYRYKTDCHECHVRLYEGSYEEEQKSANSIWEVEVDANTKKGEPIKVIDKDKEVTQLTNTRYKLRHFVTGKLMTLRDL